MSGPGLEDEVAKLTLDVSDCVSKEKGTKVDVIEVDEDSRNETPSGVPV